MDIVKTIINNTDPVHIAYEKEYGHLFLCFCTFICVVKNKKLNLPNIFLLLLQDKNLREVFKSICDVDTDYDVLKCFLQHDPTLHRSKYIKNFLAANEGLRLTF
ncbi:hypothetical protein CL634_09825 [bacterium]|nr:hypothetical protein [bacterium]